MKAITPFLLSAYSLAAFATGHADEPVLYQTEDFTVMPGGVRQGRFEATADSRDQLRTNYPRAAAEVMFKFSVNGTENEFPPGQDQKIYLRPEDGRIVTPVYVFGVPAASDPPRAESVPSSEEGRVEVTFRVDMREMERQFEKTGFFDPPNGPPISEEAFEGVYIMGNTAPLTWEMDKLKPGSPLQLHDDDGDGIFTATLAFEATYNRPLNDDGESVWTLSADLSEFPEYRSPQMLVDAVYRLSLEELSALMRNDGRLMAGAKWPDVWTRDLAWGALLGFAAIAPDTVRDSLLARIDARGRIRQDLGTGGSWPVSTDRVAWALAAWELYLVTGDRDWLQDAFDVIRKSVAADLAVAFDPRTGLFYGESSFLDWREQSYPAWMDPKDIYLSQSLGTNALHYQAWRVLARMAKSLGEAPDEFTAVAETVKQGMNTYLWMSDAGYYGQYRYGRNYPRLSPRAEGLGEAFTMLFGIASPAQQKRILESAPVVPFGVPSFWPYIPDVPPYHNAGIWPQVVGFWTWAGAEAGHSASVEHGLASLLRATAFFQTNKENMVAATGHFEGTELNSDRLIGSVGAGLAAVYRVLLGMRFHEDSLEFKPFVPRAYAGVRELTGLRYRDAVLDVRVSGYGDSVRAARLDGRDVPTASISANLTGRHVLEIDMNNAISPSRVNIAANSFAPETPQPGLDSGRLRWQPVPDAASYVVARNGEIIQVTAATQVRVRAAEALAEYQVQAIGHDGLSSFFSAPLRAVADTEEMIVEPAEGVLDTDGSGFEGQGFVTTTAGRHTRIDMNLDIERAGRYGIDVRYANGGGPVNSGDTAAIRSLWIDGRHHGSVVMPHRGKDNWSDWGYSNPVSVRLDAGPHEFLLIFTNTDQNMNGDLNEARVDHLRLTYLGP